jgi:oxidase EvaA
VSWRVEPLDPLESREWRYTSERVEHHTGRFFSITGLAYTAPAERERRFQPIVDQREIGILGFVVQRGPFGVRVLVQEKMEPGNISGPQLAPTCQATTSNLERVHGGDAPPGANLFAPGVVGRLLASSLQSEQGSRFFHKRNRNMTLDLNGAAPPPSSRHLRWMAGRELLDRLSQDHAVNTDARSVLVCTPWSTWVEEPFAGRRAPLQAWLRAAYHLQSGSEHARRVQAHRRWLARERRRLRGGTAHLVPLSALPGYHAAVSGLFSPPDAAWDLRHFSVRIPERERAEWDQPLIVSRGSGSSTLCIFRRGTDLRLLFRATWEPGLHDAVELHATSFRPPGNVAGPAAPFDAIAQAPALLETLQSEEGGRFFRECTRHRIVLIADPGRALPEGYRDVGVRETEALAAAGAFTNEARSTISLLLSLA